MIKRVGIFVDVILSNFAIAIHDVDDEDSNYDAVEYLHKYFRVCLSIIVQ